jgi:hypothetical protein
VGFFRFSGAAAAALADRCAAYVEEGRADLEYEEAIRDLILAAPHRFGAADVTALPWIEIDFEADVARARTEILPLLECSPLGRMPWRRRRRGASPRLVRHRSMPMMSAAHQRACFEGSE